MTLDHLLSVASGQKRKLADKECQHLLAKQESCLRKGESPHLCAHNFMETVLADDFKSDLVISNALTVPAWELSESFVRASGPGGQHVNKTSTAVQLRWSPAASSIPKPIKDRFLRLYSARISKAGDLVLEAGNHRSQVLNREAVRKRLKEMIVRATTQPKRRIKTRPSKGSVRRRLHAKKVRSGLKNLRGKVNPDD
ncbi:MAG: alternative ribosome rescue aminoacyl-tRNA hydrolase ArfB [Pseudomonadota bacterium]